MRVPARERCTTNPSEEILHEHPAAREPGSNPATVSLPADIDLNEQRRLLRELISAQPLPADVTVTAATLGGVQPPRSQSTESNLATLCCTSTAACTY